MKYLGIVALIVNLQSLLALKQYGMDCPTLMYSHKLANIPPSFPGVVAHGIHSLTLPDINYFFPNNKSNNIRLPVINPDLISRHPILYTPLDFEHIFEGPALRLIDQVLTHMNEPYHDLALYTNLEKIVHGAHMQDTWIAAGNEYMKLKVIVPNILTKLIQMCYLFQELEHYNIEI